MIGPRGWKINGPCHMGSVLREYNTLVYCAWEADAKPWLKVSNLEARGVQLARKLNLTKESPKRRSFSK